MTEISVPAFAYGNYSICFYEELLPVYQMALPYIQAAWSTRRVLQRLSLASLDEIKNGIRREKRTLHMLAESTAQSMNVQSDRIVTAGPLLKQNAGYEAFEQACEAFCEECEALWNEKTEEFADFEQEVLHTANGMIETPGYRIITSDPVAAFIYHEQAQNRVKRSQERAQEYYDIKQLVYSV